MSNRDMKRRSVTDLQARATAINDPDSPVGRTLSPASLPPLTMRGALRHWRATLAAAVVVAVVAVSVLLSLPVTPDTPHTPGVVELAPANDSLNCVRDAAWSPNGRYVALLGYSGGCPPALPPGATSAVGRVIIYNASSGAVYARITLDTAIRDVLHTASGAAASTDIEYHAVLWRRDSGQLAVAFDVSPSSHASPTLTGHSATILGVLLAGVDGAHPVVLTHTLGAGEPAAGEWNLHTGAYLLGPVAPPQLALAYTWTSAGALAPAAPIAGSAALSGAVGQPATDTTFTLWQPARITREGGSATDYATPAVYVYRTSFSAWSPDGTYFVPSLGLAARLQPAGQPIPEPRALHAAGADLLPLVPVRDAALATALERLVLVSSDSTDGPMVTAWSPNGRMLAVQLVPTEPNAEPSRTDHAILVYDSAIGKPLTALVPRIGPRRFSGDTQLRWSPDGTRLLLCDPALGTVMLWGAGNVPHA